MVDLPIFVHEINGERKKEALRIYKDY